MDTSIQSTEIDEETLVKQAVNGNLDAFNQLVLKYQGMAYNHARFMLGNHAQAEDVTQESFLKAFQGMNSFRGGSFPSWLLKIIRNSAYDMQRRAARHPTQSLDPEDEQGERIEAPPWLADPSPSVQHTAEQNELRKDIYRMLDELPDVFREVLTLIDLHEFDYTEAAHVLAIPIGTVKSRLARARLQMSEKLRRSEQVILPKLPDVRHTVGKHVSTVRHVT